MYLSLVSQAQQGEVSVITSLGDPLYKMELSSLVPYSGLVSIWVSSLVTFFYSLSNSLAILTRFGCPIRLLSDKF
jgi:hypothetical protein